MFGVTSVGFHMVLVNACECCSDSHMRAPLEQISSTQLEAMSACTKKFVLNSLCRNPTI